MDRSTYSGVEVYKFPSSWWQVAYSNEFNEYVVVEIHELPELEDLSHFKDNMEHAVKMARELNSDLRKQRANGATFTV